jgi:general secretion pathway protein G
MFDTASSARTSATRQSLGVVRNAIELYRAQNGSYPGQTGNQTDFKSEIRPFLQGPFPTCEVGVSGTSVRMESGADALTPGGASSWAFNSQTGQFIVDHSVGADW